MKSDLLFAPGPIRIPVNVKLAFLHDPPYFTTSRFSDLLAEVQGKLKLVFNTENEVLIGVGSGSLGMECSVFNFFNEGDDVLVLDTGKYGKNWYKMCRQYGLNARVLQPLGPGFSVLPSSIYDMITPNCKGFFVTHVETTTAILNDIAAYKKIVEERAPEALFVVDAVSSLLTEPLESRNYDVVISASQKALSCPPGLFFMTASEKALCRATMSKLPKFYFDVLNEHERSLRHITTFTPATSLIYALNVALDSILHKGTTQIIEETRNYADYIREIVTFYFRLFSLSPCNAVTAFSTSNANMFVDRCEQCGLILGRGLREQHDKLFRIAHFGWDLNMKEIRKALAIIERVQTQFS